MILYISFLRNPQYWGIGSMGEAQLSESLFIRYAALGTSPKDQVRRETHNLVTVGLFLVVIYSPLPLPSGSCQRYRTSTPTTRASTLPQAHAHSPTSCLARCASHSPTFPAYERSIVCTTSACLVRTQNGRSAERKVYPSPNCDVWVYVCRYPRNRLCHDSILQVERLSRAYHGGTEGRFQGEG